MSSFYCSSTWRCKKWIFQLFTNDCQQKCFVIKWLQFRWISFGWFSDVVSVVGFHSWLKLSNLSWCYHMINLLLREVSVPTKTWWWCISKKKVLSIRELWWITTVNEKKNRRLVSINESIVTLNQKKCLLESTITDLKKDSDEYAFKAEKETKLTLVKNLISKSNALKRAASEKQEELDECLKKKKQLIEMKKEIYRILAHYES